MIINASTINGLYTGFKTLFNQALTTAQPTWQRIATRVPSTNGEETYAWLGAFPSLREWIGDKQIKNLEAMSYSIRNKDFESTIAVPRNDIEDDHLGLYNPLFTQLGQSAALWPEHLVYTLLKAGFSSTCYDGKAFFATDHKVGKLTFANKGTKKLTADNYGMARAAMMGIKDEDGKSLNIIPNLLVVPPALEGMARRILMAEQIDSTTNTYKGTAELLVVPELSGDDTKWYLLCTTKAINPIIFQERKKPHLIRKDQESDDNVFYKGKYLYGAEARGNVGYGLWQLAYGSTGTTA